jgi:hypothetical protein
MPHASQCNSMGLFATQEFNIVEHAGVNDVSLTNAPPMWPVLVAALMCWSDAASSTNGGGPGLHSKPLELDTIIGWVFAPYRACRWQGQGRIQKKRQKGPYLSAVSLTVAVRQYNAKLITQLRGSRDTMEATGRLHWASTAANIWNWSCIRCFFPSFFIIDPLISR